jgi:hypothetical protein
MAIEELKRPKTPATGHITAQLIKAVGRKICSEIHKLISPTWYNEDLLKQWKALVIVLI